MSHTARYCTSIIVLTCHFGRHNKSNGVDQPTPQTARCGGKSKGRKSPSIVYFVGGLMLMKSAYELAFPFKIMIMAILPQCTKRESDQKSKWGIVHIVLSLQFIIVVARLLVVVRGLWTTGVLAWFVESSRVHLHVL
jgi:hypothetical protein